MKGESFQENGGESESKVKASGPIICIQGARREIMLRRLQGLKSHPCPALISDYKMGIGNTIALAAGHTLTFLNLHLSIKNSRSVGASFYTARDFMLHC